MPTTVPTTVPATVPPDGAPWHWARRCAAGAVVLGEVDSWRAEEVESDVDVQVLMAASPEHHEVRQHG